MSGLLHRSLVLGVMIWCLLASGCHAGEQQPGPPAAPAVAPGAGSAGFSQYYHPITVVTTGNAPGYTLPLDLGKITNGDMIRGISPTDRAQLQKNGLLLRPPSGSSNIVNFYHLIEEQGDPVYVTPDAVLHIFHIQFNETLKTIEEEKLIPLALTITQRMQEASAAQVKSFTGDLQEAARRNLAYFSVARQLLDAPATPPAAVAPVVRQEIALIEAHQGFSPSPLFGYQEDYSQYVPRGHYTRSEPLKAYFKAMMWYGRLAFLLKGQDLSPTALVSAEEARRQTLQAALIAGLVYGLGPGGDARIGQDWQRLYRATAFFAGLADDLTPSQYADAVKQVAGASLSWAKLADPATLVALRDRLAALPGPKIFGGTGNTVLQPPFSPDQLNQLLGNTQGMHFLGQRYTPDSFIFQQLIEPAVGAFQGTGHPFTMEKTQGGPLRVWARGLDLMAVLGSDRALQELKEEGDTSFANYDRQMTALRGQFAGMKAEDWGKDLYTGWVYSLQALIQPRPEGYPNFMRTPAWENRQLQAALASWAQLRHDTILYAKQPYAPKAAAAPAPAPPAPQSVGYVEPVPEFYARMVALTRCMQNGLEDMGLLSDNLKDRLVTRSNLLTSLANISLAELAGQPLGDQQQYLIKSFSYSLQEGLEGVDPEGLRTTVVADVLTDANTGRVLEEGSGYLREIVVAYSDVNGHVFLGRGAALSYYEFKHPLADRLTDEAWRTLLDSPAAPPAPAWAG